MRREASDGRGTQNAGLGRPAAARADAAPPQHGSRTAITVTAPAGWRTQVPTTAPDAPRADTVATPNSAGGGTFCVWEPYLPCTPPGHLRPGGVRVRRQARLHGHRRNGVRDGVVRLPGDPQPLLLHAAPRLRSRSASARAAPPAYARASCRRPRTASPEHPPWRHPACERRRRPLGTHRRRADPELWPCRPPRSSGSPDAVSRALSRRKADTAPVGLLRLHGRPATAPRRLHRPPDRHHRFDDPPAQPQEVPMKMLIIVS